MKMAGVCVSACIVRVELLVERFFHQILELMKTGDDEQFQNRAVSEKFENVGMEKERLIFTQKKGVQK